MKKKIAISIIVTVLTLAIIVPVAAAAGSTATGPGSLLDYARSLVQKLVTDKKLAQADADQLLADLEAKETALKAERQANGKGIRDGKGIASGLSVADTAALLGMTEADLKAKLEQGTSLWKIAADAGKLDALKDAMIKNITTRLDALVTAGKLTKEQAAQQLADITARIKAITADSTGSMRGLAPADQGMKRGMRGDGPGNRPGQKADGSTKTVPAASAPAATGTSA